MTVRLIHNITNDQGNNTSQNTEFLYIYSIILDLNPQNSTLQI